VEERGGCGGMTWMEAYFHWRPLLIEALDARYYNPEWLDSQVMTGRAIFLPGDDCALVAEVRFYPTGARDIFVIATAGDPIKTRDQMVPQLEAWGRKTGCLAVTGESRGGWAKVLRPAAFETYKVGVRKALSDG
jgi:hypothetical protein